MYEQCLLLMFVSGDPIVIVVISLCFLGDLTGDSTVRMDLVLTIESHQGSDR